MKHNAIPAAAGLALAVLAASTALAQQDPDVVSPQTPAPAAAPVAAATRLPLPPQAQNLAELHFGGAQSLRYLVDTASIDSDGATLVSYTLVARSRSGFDNVSFETIDCAAGSWRIVATWIDGSWHRVRDTAWQPLGSHSTPHGALAQDALCAAHAVAGSSAQLAATLRLGPRGWDQKFQP